MDSLEDQIDLAGLSVTQRAQLRQMLSSFGPSWEAPPPSAQLRSSPTDSSTPGRIGIPSSHSLGPRITPYRSVQLASTTRNGTQVEGAPSQVADHPLPLASLPRRPPATPTSAHTMLSSTQPSSSFLSFHNMRREVNQQRLEAAAVNLAPQRRRSTTTARVPPTQTLQPRVARTAGRSIRGAARPLPRLQSLRAIENCYNYDANQNLESIKTIVQIYPKPIRVC